MRQNPKASRWKGDIMRRTIVGLVSAILICASPAPGQTRWNASLSLGDDNGQSFYLAIGDYFNVPSQEVIIARDRGIQDEELPILFYIASQARVSPEYVMNLRLSGMSWDQITFHLGLGPGIYYVPVPAQVVVGPYARPYGYFHHYQRRQWSRIHLTDGEITNLVDLRFASDVGHMPRAEVIRMRSAGSPFPVIIGHGRVDRGHGQSHPYGRHEDSRRGWPSGGGHEHQRR